MEVYTDNRNGWQLFSISLKFKRSIPDDTSADDYAHLEYVRRQRSERREHKIALGKHSRHMRRVVHQARHRWPFSSQR